MFWGSIGLNGITTLFNVLESTHPDKNWGLYGLELASRLPEDYQNKLKRIEAIKNKVCLSANIPSEKVTIRLQDRGIFENHGNANQAVLGISLKFLESYQPQNIKEKNDPYANFRSTRFKEFLNKLPDYPDQIKRHIKALSPKERKEYHRLAEDYALHLNDQEIQFIISHEILGHMSSNDTLKTGVFSTLLGINASCLANLANNCLAFSGSSFVWQAVFHSVSYIALQSVVINRQERQADANALTISDNIKGGISFFKRILAVNLLDKYQKHPTGTSSHFYHLFTNNEGESFFNFSHENASDRLLRCLEVIPIRKNKLINSN
jgi:Peptidase family M48